MVTSSSSHVLSISSRRNGKMYIRSCICQHKAKNTTQTLSHGEFTAVSTQHKTHHTNTITWRIYCCICPTQNTPHTVTWRIYCCIYPTQNTPHKHHHMENLLLYLPNTKHTTHKHYHMDNLLLYLPNRRVLKETFNLFYHISS